MLLTFMPKCPIPDRNKKQVVVGTTLKEIGDENMKKMVSFKKVMAFVLAFVMLVSGANFFALGLPAGEPAKMSMSNINSGGGYSSR